MAVQSEWRQHVGIIVIDRPDKRNAVDLDSLQQISAIQQEAIRRKCRVLVVRGEPPAFCSGADLDGAELGEFTEVLGKVLRGFAQWPGLAVAFVDGPALGAGLQIAAACDVRIATRGSPIGIPAAKLGLAVDVWTVERMVREIGWGPARTMLLTGDPLSVDDVVPGFIARTLESASALEVAMALIEEWSRRAPLTVAAHKLAIERAGGADLDLDIVEAARLRAWKSSDAIEGRSAFLERRPPSFRGE